ncbi:7761_t:CDS:2 [Ambispora gerdemannii]|uniref:Probable cytosolic iron-sulfur protein assembly protein 1 n=1 Tax=Ambispora gerdemannii TaxID=144530 RepID=A0A9N8WF94_9GLOM|nr:7761_t:CDS:2 [Ambispora gerdemannii]
MPRLELLAELKGHTDRVWSVTWSPTSNILASCGGDKTVRLWTPTTSELSQWTCTNVLEGAHTRTIRSVAWSPNGRHLATGSFDATAGIWARDENGEYECVATLEGHENETKAVSWSTSGTLLATCGRDKSVWIWEVGADNDFECISVQQEHTQDAKMVIWHPSEELLASASYDDTIKIWKEDEDDWYCSDTLEGHESTVWAIDFDKSGDYLVSASDDKTLKFWKRYSPDQVDGNIGKHRVDPKWKCMCTLSGHHQRCIYSVSWSKVHGLLASGSADNMIRVFERVSSSTITIPDNTTDIVSGTMNNFDNATISNNNDSNDDTLNYTVVASISSAHGVADVNCVQWHPSEIHDNLLASAGDDGIVRIWKYCKE